ncbi:MAG: DUF6754 domain-containing protein [Chloroflexota bacterium]
MAVNTELVVAGVIVGVALLLAWRTRRGAAGARPTLRPLPAYDELTTLAARALEAGRVVVVSVGRAALGRQATPTSVSALTVLRRAALDGCATGTPPAVTVGEATLLPAAQDELRWAFQAVGRAAHFSLAQVEFVAAGQDGLAYAAGVSQTLPREAAASCVVVGRYGPELVLITEAAARAQAELIVGVDEPAALAVAAAASSQPLLAEEMLAAGAYLDGRPSQIASLQTQDVLRWLVALGLMGLALFQLAQG